MGSRPRLLLRLRLALCPLRIALRLHVRSRDGVSVCFHQELCGVSGAPSVTDACPATAIHRRDVSPRARNKIG